MLIGIYLFSLIIMVYWTREQFEKIASYPTQLQKRFRLYKITFVLMTILPVGNTLSILVIAFLPAMPWLTGEK